MENLTDYIRRKPKIYQEILKSLFDIVHNVDISVFTSKVGIQFKILNFWILRFTQKGPIYLYVFVYTWIRLKFELLGICSLVF